MKRISQQTAALALVAVLGLGTASFARAQDRDDRPQKHTAAQKTEKGEPEEHPVIREALRQLQQTKKLLETRAAHDFKGHRVQAIQSIDQAIAHLNQALQVDKK